MKVSLTTTTKTIFFAYVLLSSPVSLGLDISMDFENGSPGSVVSSHTCEINGDPVFTFASGQTFFTTDDAYGQGQSAELNISKDSDGYGSWGGGILFEECGSGVLTKGDEVWVRVRTKFPVGFNYRANPKLKFLRFHTSKYEGCTTDCHDGYIDLYINRPEEITGWWESPGQWVEYPDIPYGFIKEGISTPGQGWKYFGNIDDKIILGQWLTYELYLKMDSESVDDGGEALIRLWRDGILMTEITDRRTLDTDKAVADLFYLFTYWNGNSPKTQKMYVDDFRMITTPDIPSDVDADLNPMIGTGNNTIPRPPVIVSLTAK